MNVTIAALLAVISLGAVLGYRLDKMTMRIMENGKEVDEKIYVDTEDNYEIFSVPAHGDRSTMLLVNDFKRGYSIYKINDDSKCYVVPLKAGIEKPSQLKKSIEQVHSHFPSSKFTVEHKTFLEKGAFDLTTSMGKLAAKFCGGFEVLDAEAVMGDVDLAKIADEEQKKLNARSEGGRVKRDVVIRDFAMACSQQQVTNSLSTCPQQHANLRVVCRFRNSRGCVYSVNCDFGLVNHQHQATCAGNHQLSSTVCCDYNCP